MTAPATRSFVKHQGKIIGSVFGPEGYGDRFAAYYDGVRIGSSGSRVEATEMVRRMHAKKLEAKKST